MADSDRLASGGCHCGAVAFTVSVPDNAVAHACNCSICRASGFVGLIVPAERFELLRGEKALREYRFNTGVARHWFCGTCGVKSFYRPRSNPEGVSINIHTLEQHWMAEITIEPFDGQHWERYAHTLAHLTRPAAE
ncbi:MAG: GFA family protein [Pseudomonadota bacterium]